MSIKPSEQTFWKVVAADIIAFDQHKNAMLDDLIKAYESGCNPSAFDANKAWVDLTRVAKFYFSDRAMRQEAIIPAERVKRLNAFAKALRSARGTIGNDLDGDLLRGWIAAVGLTIDSLVVDGVALQRETDELNRALTNLVILETAARRATSTVRTQRGRPKGNSVLPPIYINELARVFLESTGLKYDASDGLFAQFVRSFLAAIRPSADESDGYVVESIKYARKLARKNPSGSALSFL
jgi:hypothetical protein